MKGIDLTFEDLGKYILIDKKEWIQVVRWLKKVGINVDRKLEDERENEVN